MREPLKWPGGTRLSASGLVVEIHTDEGIVGHRRGAGPDAADDPDDHRGRDGAVPRRPGSAADRVDRAPAGGVLAQLERDRRLRDRRDRDGAARHQGQGARRARGGAARRLLPRRGRRWSATSSSTSPRRTRRRRRRSSTPASPSSSSRSGATSARTTTRSRRSATAVGSDVKLRIDANMIWSVPAAIKWIRGLEQLRPAVRRAARARLRRAGPRAGAALGRRADRRRRGVHERPLGARADQGRRVRRVRRLPLGGRRADARLPHRRARRRRRQVVRDRQLGRARRRDDRERPRRRGLAELRLRERHALPAPDGRRPRRAARDGRRHRSPSPRPPGSASSSTPTRSSASRNFRSEKASSMTTSTEKRPGSVRSSDRPPRKEGRAVSTTTKHPTARERASSTVVTCWSRQASSAPAPSLPVRSPAGRRPRPSAARATPIKRGGRLIWALESDPVHVAPFGQILTAGHWGKEFAYDSLVEWDRNLNVKPALASVVQDRQQDRDPLEPEEGDQVPQRQGAHRGRRGVLGREDAQPAVAGQHLHRRPGPGDRGRATPSRSTWCGCG